MAGNFQVSSKLPDGRIFVVAGETYADFCEKLEHAVGVEKSQTLLEVMATSLAGTSMSAPTQTNPYENLDRANAAIASAFPGSSIVNPTPPGIASAPSGRECKHGPMTKREGSGEKGPWKGYMCPTPKGTPDQCKAEFVRRGTPEWNTF
jgi:hypothetical protein